jgi:hypothetical protein
MPGYSVREASWSWTKSLPRALKAIAATTLSALLLLLTVPGTWVTAKDRSRHHGERGRQTLRMPVGLREDEVRQSALGSRAVRSRDGGERG